MVQLHQQLFEVLGQHIEIEPDVDSLSFHLAQELPVDLDFKQALLEMKSEAERIETLTEYYRATIPKIENDHARAATCQRQRTCALILSLALAYESHVNYFQRPFMNLPRTLGELRKSSFSEQRLRTRRVKDELRENLIARLRSGETIFPGIIGYEDTVVPQLVNAVLSRHNFICSACADRPRAVSCAH